MKTKNRDRIAIVRQVIESLPEDSIDHRVLICLLQNYSDMDIRDELQITKKSLQESRGRIKQMLIEAQDGKLYEIKEVEHGEN